MYLPPQFKGDRAQAVALISEYPFASLISLDDTGLPYVTHLPLHLEEHGAELVLLGHVAKPNPHWRYLQARAQALVTFLGPHAYLSPKVYPDLARVPTWTRSRSPTWWPRLSLTSLNLSRSSSSSA